MLLDKSARKLQLQLLGAQAENPLQITTQYLDTINEKQIPETIFTTSNGTTPVDILAAPKDSTARDVIEIHVYNADIVAQLAQVIIYTGAGQQIIQAAYLNPSDTLHYNKYNGWSIQNGSGNGAAGTTKNWRLVTLDDAATLADDIIFVDASGGNKTMTFNPNIVPSGAIAKEIKYIKVDISANRVFISNGTITIETLIAYQDAVEMIGTHTELWSS